MDGFLLDAYSDAARGEMVLWVKTRAGAVRLAEPFTPTLYARARPGASLRGLQDALGLLRGVGETRVTHARCGLEEAPSQVLQVPVVDHRQVGKVAQLVDAHGGYHDYEVFDADLRMAHRYFLARGLWPLCRVRAWSARRCRLLESDRWALDYPMPELGVLEVGAQARAAAGEIPGPDTPLRRVWVQEGEARQEAACDDEAEMLRWLCEQVRARDPDVVLTTGGDTFLLPYLHARADALEEPFLLGREPDPVRPRKRAKSYFSYGRIKFQPAAYALHGRIHIDRASSFFYSEAGLYGLVDLARLSNVPLQDLARLGAGTALTAIQIDLAKQQGRLVPWKKNVAEGFRDARALLLADRGGYIFEPRVGLHEDVVELDFASLYPNLMLRHNISPETICCACCSPSTLPFERVTPQLSTWTCARREGFIPTYLAPLIHRREAFKRRRKEDPDNRERHQQGADVLKWLLVTSFGYQGYKNAKFGHIACHEAISAWARETILSAAEIARDEGFEWVHGIVDSLWLRRVVPGSDARALEARVTRELGIRFELQGRFKWIVFLPTRAWPQTRDAPAVGALNRYYGCLDAPPDRPSRSQAGQPLDYLAGGALKVRGVELRQHASCLVAREAQERFLGVVARAGDAAAFMALLPEAIEATRPVLRRVLEGACGLEEVTLAAAVSKEAGAYRALTGPGAALKQLARRGVHVQPGEVVRYVVLDAASRDAERKVREARLLRGDEAYDAQAYARLVLRAVASLALPFGYDEARLGALLGHEGSTPRARSATTQTRL